MSHRPFIGLSLTIMSVCLASSALASLEKHTLRKSRLAVAAPVVVVTAEAVPVVDAEGNIVLEAAAEKIIAPEKKLVKIAEDIPDTHIEDVAADAMLNGELKEGGTYTVSKDKKENKHTCK